MIDKTLTTAASPLARLRAVHPLAPWVLSGIVLVPLHNPVEMAEMVVANKEQFYG